jgi:hypothetical protein
MRSKRAAATYSGNSFLATCRRTTGWRDDLGWSNVQFGRISTSFIALAGLLGATACTKSSSDSPARDTVAARPAGADSGPAIDPRAVEIVNRMGDYLGTLTAYSIQTETTTDEVLEPGGPKIQFGSTGNVTVRRPDRLYAKIVNDTSEHEIFYDGKTLTLYGDKTKFYAIAPAPPTIHEMVNSVMDKYHLTLPVSDLLQSAAHKSLLQNATAGIVVGPSRIDGVETDHLAFHQNNLDWQLWVEKGDRPLPRKLLITTLDERGHPQHGTVLRWNLSPRINERMFSFIPPAGAERIVFAAADSGTAAPPPVAGDTSNQ